MRDSGLHRLRGLQHERQLHLARAEEVADDLHPAQQHVVHDRERGRAGRERLVEVAVEAVAIAVDDAVLEALVDRPAGAVLLRGRRRLHAGEHLEEPLQRVVARTPPIVDEVEADLALLLGEARQRDDAPGVHDRGIEPGSDALVQEHRVERVTSRGAEPERHVRHAEHRERSWDLGLDPADRLDGRDRVTAQVVVTRRQRERQGVEDQIARVQPIARRREVVDAVCDLHLPLDVTRLAALVDQQADDRGAVLRGEAHHTVEARAGRFAVLEVRRS